jgi:hypothetical protein
MWTAQLCSQYLKLLRSKAGEATGAAAVAARDEASKINQAGHGTQSYSFVPLGVESCDYVGKEADLLLKDLVDGAASTRACERVVYIVPSFIWSSILSSR